MPHDIQNCEGCRRIFMILLFKDAFEIKEGIRFNELRRLLEKLGDKKIAPKTLQVHLKPLIKNKVVKKTRIARENVSYFLNTNSEIFSKESLERSEKWLSKNEDRIKSWNLTRIFEIYLLMSRLLELENLRLWLKRQNGKMNQATYALGVEVERHFYRQSGRILLDTAKQKQAEFLEAENNIDIAIADLKATIFSKD